MKSGTVKWFDSNKGFGFIEQEAGDDCFVHVGDLEDVRNGLLKEGDPVEFDVEETTRGLKARNVRLV